MINEPIEAELARPPIFTDQQESQLRDQDEEGLHSPASPTPTLHNDTSTRHDVPQARADVEMGKGEKIVIHFDPGTGEDPRGWSKAKKWSVRVSWRWREKAEIQDEHHGSIYALLGCSFGKRNANW